MIILYLVRAGFLLPPQSQTYFLPGIEYDPGLARPNSNPEQIARDLRLSLKSEERLNKRLGKSDRNYMSVAIKNGQPLYHAHAQLRDKYYHAWIFDKNLPLSKTKLKGLQKISSYPKRLKALRNHPLISDDDIYRLSGLIRKHVLDPNIKVIRGTLGANRERKIDLKRQTNPELRRVPKLQGYLVYNKKTKVACFYDLKDRNLRTFQSIARESDLTDLLENRNLN